MNKRPLILVTNDDGITAPGITALVDFVKDFGTPVVVAPDSPQSGQGHAITLNKPLRLKPSTHFGADVQAYACSGTPVDCVKIAKHRVLKGQEIDLCVSGINHGSNVAINILYSGTMSAAMEASLEGINSIGFSLLDFNYDADFHAAESYIKHIIKATLENGLNDTKLLNVNIPKLPKEKIKGIKICHQADAQWEESFQERKDPMEKSYYWMGGTFVNRDHSEDSDVWALSRGFISVVPCIHDLTAYKAMSGLKSLEL